MIRTRVFLALAFLMAAAASAACIVPWAAAESPVPGLPDLTINADILQRSLRIDTAFFTRGDCAVVEGCVGGTGRRTLLRFSVATPNIGTADLFMGNPEGNPLFEYSDCHGHYHFSGYASYELLDSHGKTVVTGRKQAFCLLDSYPVSPEAGPPKYNCDYQGISVGWMDIYDASLDCQWLDITGVPPGDYQLRVIINPEGILDEMSYENNMAVVPVRIPRRASRGR
jgi:hypothetical protein